MADVHRPYSVVSVTAATGSLHVWRAGEGAPRSTQTGCHASEAGLALLDARIVAVSANKGGATTLVTHDVARPAGGPCARVGGPETTLTSITAQHGLLAAGGKSGTLYVWHATAGTMVAMHRAHAATVSRVEFAGKGTILTAGADGSVHAWRTHELCSKNVQPSPAVTLRHALPVCAMAVGSGLAPAIRVATLAADRTARLWRLGAAAPLGSVILEAPGVALELAPAEDVLYVACANANVVVAPIAALNNLTPVSAARLPALRANTSTSCTALALANHGQEVLVGYDDGAVRAFDAATRVQIHVYRRHVAHPITNLIVFPSPIVTEESHTIFTPPMQEPAVWAKSVARDVDFEPPVCAGGRRDPIAIAWHHVDGPEWNQPTPQNPNPNNPPSELLAELSALRARNAALEAAGAKLCDMLQSIN